MVRTLCRPTLNIRVKIGSFSQLFSRTGWDFYSHLNHNYGPVVKIYSMLGVRMINLTYAIPLPTHPASSLEASTSMIPWRWQAS